VAISRPVRTPHSERMPLWPLIATLAIQTLATMALFSLPAAAPVVVRDLGVDSGLVGLFVSMVYGFGIISAVMSPGFIHRYGAVRVSQTALVGAALMLLVTAAGTLASIGLGALLLGIGYGANAPAATHLLVPQTPRRVFNLVMSVRQIGVPLGGILGALIVPPLVVAIGWPAAMAAQAVPILLLVVVLQFHRARWDAGRDPARPVWGGVLPQLLRLLAESAAIRRLSIACFVYTGVQLSFIAFMTVHLTSAAGFDLIAAGQALAVYQIAGAVARPVWGWVADRFMSPSPILALCGLVMGASAVAAGWFGPGWPVWLIMLVCVIAGFTASGYTGVAYAEFANLGGARRTEATGLGTATMFLGAMLIPSTMGFVLTATGNYTLCFGILAVMSCLAGILLVMAPRRAGGT
jgi:MFS family permease